MDATPLYKLETQLTSQMQNVFKQSPSGKYPSYNLVLIDDTSNFSCLNMMHWNCQFWVEQTILAIVVLR